MSLKELMWSRHRNPWSGWTRVLVGFAMGHALWLHDWTYLAITIVAVITNPFWFPAPKRDDAWMTRAVDGERLWLDQADWLDKSVFFGPSAVMSLVLIWALYLQDPIWSAIAGATVVIHKFLFLFFCVRLVDTVNRLD